MSQAQGFHPRGTFFFTAGCKIAMQTISKSRKKKKKKKRKKARGKQITRQDNLARHGTILRRRDKWQAQDTDHRATRQDKTIPDSVLRLELTCI
jgi:hypothetical protein